MVRVFNPLILLGLLLGISAPCGAQQRPHPYDPILGEGPESIIGRAQWFNKGRNSDGDTGLWQQRMDAWEQVSVMAHANSQSIGKSNAVASAQWTCIGPNNQAGRLTGIAIHPWDPDIVYMTAANGGIWKSTDGGVTVDPIADNLPTLAMGAIAIDPSDPDIVYAGSGEANIWPYSYPGVGVFRSTDAGRTWQLTGLQGDTRIARICVHPMKGYLVLAATMDGLWRSTNHGDTWQKVLLGEVYDLAIHPYLDYMYAGVRGQGIFQSRDNGISWKYLSDRWDEFGIDTKDIRRIALDISPADPGTVYTVLVANNSSVIAVLRTMDDGASWDELVKPIYNVFGGQGFYNCDLAADPLNPNRVIIGGILLYETSNNGVDWQIKSPSHVDQHAVEFAPSDGNILYVGHDGGFDRSDDGGRTFAHSNASMPVAQYYDIDISHHNPDVLLAGAQDNGSHLGSTMNPDWRRVTLFDGGICHIDPQDPAYMYTERESGATRWRSSDSGTTWKAITSGLSGTGAWVTPWLIHPADSRILFTATSAGVFKTTNRGDGWFKIADPAVSGRTIQTLAISPADPLRMASGYDGSAGLAFSADGGNSWTRCQTSFLNPITDIVYHGSNPALLYATCGGWGGRNVLRSDDAGVTWEDITGDLPPGPVNAIALHPSNDDVLLVGTDMGVFVTYNAGQHWEIAGYGMPVVPVLDLEYHPLSGRLFAATHGRGIWELGGFTSVDIETGSVVYTNGTAVVRWSARSVPRVSGFAVERKEEHTDSWTEIGYVPAAGCAASQCDYRYEDPNVPVQSGAVLYRIRSIRSDGEVQYSNEMFLALGASAPRTPELYQNYPNPCNPGTNIRFSLPASGQVRLELTDARGMQRTILYEGHASPGPHSVHLDASNLAGGVYFYHLITGAQRTTRKLVVLK